jgi:hypothetical protein
MKLLILCLLALAAGAAITSCGGDGGPKNFTPTTLAVQNIERLASLSIANGGVGVTGQADGISTSIGGFVRHFGGSDGIAMSTVRRSLEAAKPGTSAGGENFYYDELLQFWVDLRWTETTFTGTFYVDQAKAKQAGHVKTSFVGDWNSLPQAYTSEYAFTAGTLAGAKGTYNCIQTGLFGGAMAYRNTYSDGSHDKGSSTWSEAGASVESRWDGPGTTGSFKDSGSWGPDGSGLFTCTSTDGWSGTWHPLANNSGSAHIEGPDAKLPADLVWTPSGNYKLTCVGGATEEWTRQDMWDATNLGVIVTAPAAAPTPAKPTEKKS